MMSTKQYRLLILFAMLAGLLGGILASSLFMAVPVLAGKKQERIDARTIHAEVITATAISLQGESGFDGVHMNMHRRGLMIGGKNNEASIGISVGDDGKSLLFLLGKDGYAEINITNGTPELNLTKKDKASASLSVQEKSQLSLTASDEASAVWLAAEPGKPFLMLNSGSKDDGSRPQVAISVSKGEPALRLQGKEGAQNASMFAVPKGILFNRDEKVVWQAP
jgi:hypothetical protein